MIKIDFITRSDSESKAGGDSVQVGKYVDELTLLGYSCAIIPFTIAMKLRPESIVHIMNVDRPFDFLDACQQSSGRPIIVSPIHHSRSAVRTMRKSTPTFGARDAMVARLGESTRELLSFCVRVVRCDAGRLRQKMVAIGRAVGCYTSIWSRVGRRLDDVYSVTLLANGEGIWLQEDTGWLARNAALVPNGRPPALDGAGGQTLEMTGWLERKVDVLVVGRIEPRKRQLEIAQAASRLTIPVTFIGQVNQNSDKYSQAFIDAVSKDLRLEWLGEQSSQSVLAAMADCRVLFNGSWVEVQSLVDLEASFSGCIVLANSNGNSAEWLGESVVQYDAVDVTVGLREALRCARRNIGPQLPQYAWTWKKAAHVLAGLYAGCLPGHYMASGD